MSWNRYPRVPAKTELRVAELWQQGLTPAVITKQLAGEQITTTPRQVKRIVNKLRLPPMRPAPSSGRHPHNVRQERAAVGAMEAALARVVQREQQELGQLRRRPPHLCSGRFCLICGGLG